MARIIPAFKQYFDGNGNPLIGGFLRFLVSGSNNTNKTTHSDVSKTLPNTNPVLLDGEGRCPDVFGDGAYNVISYDSNMQQIQQFDPILATFTATVEAYANIAALRAITAVPNITDATIRGYYDDGDGGANPNGYYWHLTSTDTDDGLSTFKAPAITTGRWKAKFSGDISIRFAGAKGDDSTDDTAAIQATIDYVNSIGGGVVYIPIGLYDISDTLAWKNKVSIIGESMYQCVLNQQDATKATLKPNIPIGSGGGITPDMGINMNLKNIWIKYSESGIGNDRYNYTGAIGIDINGVSLRQFIWEDIEVYACHTALRVESGNFFGGSINGFRVRNSYRGFHKTDTGGWITSLEAKFQFDQCFHGLDVSQGTYCSFELNHDAGGLGAVSTLYGPSNEMPVNASFNKAKGMTINTLGVEQNIAMQLYLTGGSQVNVLSYFTLFSTANTWTKDAARINNIPLIQQAVFSINGGSLELGAIEYIARTGDGYPAASTTDTNFIYTNIGGADPSSLTLRSGFIDVDSYYWGDTTTFLPFPDASKVYGDYIHVGAFRRIRAYDRTAAAQRTLDNKFIVDSGSNADGSWVRFSDGTQICTIDSSDITDTLSANAFGSTSGNYYTALSSVKNWPKAFDAVPKTSSNCNTPLSSGASVNIRSITATTYQTQIGHNTNSNTVGFSIVAIGTWT